MWHMTEHSKALHNKGLSVSLSAKYGLHAFNLGKLPTLLEYEKLQHLHESGLLTLFAFTLEKEFELIAQTTQAKLYLSFPTLGFTDPALDYSITPQFAVPVMVKGLVAIENSDFRAKLIATDIGANDYPLCISKQGNIDFALIEKSLSPHQHLFTTLDQITYVYSHEQLLNNKGLKLAPSKTADTVEILIPGASKNFDIQVKVVLDNRTVSERLIPYYLTYENNGDGKLQAIWQEGRVKSYLHVNYKIPPLKNYQYAFRAKVVIDIPLQEGVQYTWESAPFTKGEQTKSLRFSQYYGLSADIFKKIIASVISPQRFEADLLAKLKNEKLQGLFNRYDILPQMKTVLFDKLMCGVLNQSVPLFTLSPYFADFPEVLHNLQQMEVDVLDAHDQVVFKKLFEVLKTSQQILPLIDEIDKLLSFWEAFTQTSIVLETMGKSLNENEFNIKAYAALEDEQGCEFYRAQHHALLQVLKKHRQLSLVETKQMKNHKKEILPLGRKQDSQGLS